MLQNALAYSVDGWASLDVQIDVFKKRLRIEVRSRSRPEHLERLGQIVARMRAEPDPLKHYLELVRETAERSEGSGLGLARIRHEGEMQVEVEIRDGEVRVTAIRAIGEHTGGQT